MGFNSGFKGLNRIEILYTEKNIIRRQILVSKSVDTYWLNPGVCSHIQTSVHTLETRQININTCLYSVIDQSQQTLVNVFLATSFGSKIEPTSGLQIRVTTAQSKILDMYRVSLCTVLGYWSDDG